MTNPPRPVGRVSPPGAPPHRKIHLTTNPPPLTRTFHPRLRPTRVAQATRLSRSATRRPERNETPYCLCQIAAFIVYRPSMQPRPRPHDQKIHPMINAPRVVGQMSPPGAPPAGPFLFCPDTPPVSPPPRQNEEGAGGRSAKPQRALIDRRPSMPPRPPHRTMHPPGNPPLNERGIRRALNFCRLWVSMGKAR